MKDPPSTYSHKESEVNTVITYTKASSVAKYTKVFDKAAKALAEQNSKFEGLEISSIPQYFSVLQLLATIDPVYLMLPLDEDTFDIDLNTRTIKIPAVFAQAGVGVKGDEIAEVLYFKADRYFDAEDLNNTEIYIEWTYTPSGNGEVVRGISKEWVRDVESEPGKIIFGWPISSSITKNVGAISFAPRFVKWADDEHKIIQYSLSTIPHTVMIKDTLDLFNASNFGIAVEDKRDFMVGRAQNSIYKDTDDVASKPVYLLDLPEGVTYTTVEDATAPSGHKSIATHHPENEVDLDKNGTGTYTFKALAYSPEGGIISYVWKDNGITQNALDPSSFEFIEVPAGINAAENHVYYEYVTLTDKNGSPKKDSKGELLKGYVVRTEGITTGQPLPEGVKLFERYAVYTAKRSGEYMVTTTNNVGFAHEEAASHIAVVTVPTQPKVEALYTVKDSTGKVTATNAHIETVKGQEVYPTIHADSDENGDSSYAWFRNGEAIEIPTVVEADEHGVAINRGHRGATISPTQDGIYTVEITNTRNNDTKTSKRAEAGYSRITHAAAEPVLEYEPNVDVRRDANVVVVGDTIKVKVNKALDEPDTFDEATGAPLNVKSDRIEFTWKKVRLTPEEQAEVASKGILPGNDPANDDTIIVEKGKALESSLKVDEEGYYYCVVKNYLNTDISEPVKSIMFSAIVAAK